MPTTKSPMFAIDCEMVGDDIIHSVELHRLIKSTLNQRSLSCGWNWKRPLSQFYVLIAIA